MVHHNVCPLCSSEEIHLHLRCVDHFISKEEFELAKCSQCAFIFTQDYPEEANIGGYYESDEYISHSDISKGLINKLYRLARSLMLQKKRKLVSKTTSLNKGKILDIGSGTGYFASIMKESGWKVNGIEINKRVRDFSVKQFDVEVYGPEQISSMESDYFDCITLWHVLEHFHDPLKYASDIKRLLKPGGICLVALPNSNSFDAAYYKEFWAAYDVPRHLWHFNPESFATFTNKTGFDLETIVTLPLDVFYISLLSEKYKRTRMQFILGMAKAKLFAIKSFFNNKRSSSVIYILRKPT